MKTLSQRAYDLAYRLYEGKDTPHRSCGICLAETFGLPSKSYQSLRRGGITGEGECGAIKAGELILGEILGDPDPTGLVTDQLRTGLKLYREKWQARVDKGKSQTIVCNDLTGQFADFKGPERMLFCTNIAANVAACVAETLEEMGVKFAVNDSNPT
jgi:hypothetical protein